MTLSLKVPVLDLPGQHQKIGAVIEERVVEVLRSGRYILSENVQALEKEMAAICGAKYGIGVANGTDSLILSLWALDIGPGDEVITTPFTFAATAEAIVLRGAKPVFVDIDEKTFNMNPRLVESAVSEKTKAILPVHLYGQPADMNPIMDVARKYGLRVIEDNAQAIGATYEGKPTGSFGDTACISFYPTKNIGACGDAGMIVTNDEKIAHRLKGLRAHGMHRRYYHDELGVNSRLDELQATILLTKLAYLKEWTHRRNQIAQTYTRQLVNCPAITPPLCQPQNTHVWHQYTVRVQSSTQDNNSSARQWLTDELASKDIGSMCYYPVPLHLQKAFDQFGYKNGDFPVTERLSQEVLSLPMYPELTNEQVEYVADAINQLMNQRTAGAAVVTPFVSP